MIGERLVGVLFGAPIRYTHLDTPVEIAGELHEAEVQGDHYRFLHSEQPFGLRVGTCVACRHAPRAHFSVPESHLLGLDWGLLHPPWWGEAIHGCDAEDCQCEGFTPATLADRPRAWIVGSGVGSPEVLLWDGQGDPWRCPVGEFLSHYEPLIQSGSQQ